MRVTVFLISLFFSVFGVSQNRLLLVRDANNTTGSLITEGALVTQWTNVTGRPTALSQFTNDLGISSSSVSGTTNYVSKFTAANAVGNSDIQNNATGIGLFTTPSRKVEINLGTGGDDIMAILNGTLALGSINSYRGYGADELLYLNGSMTFSNNKSIYTINSGGSVQQSISFSDDKIGLFTSPSRKFHMDLGGGTNVGAIMNGTLNLNTINAYGGYAASEVLNVNGHITVANNFGIKTIGNTGLWVDGLMFSNGNVTVGASTGAEKFNVVGNATVSGTLTIGNASVSGHAINLGQANSTYLGISATAANSTLFNSQNAAYYLNYNNLTNKPTIPAAQVNSDWNATSGVAQIINKPTLLSQFTNDLGLSSIYLGISATATNSSALNGQNGLFYRNASNINSGTLGDAYLSSNIPRLNADNSFTGKMGIGGAIGDTVQLKVHGTISVSSNKIIDVANGTNLTDAINKSQLDAAVSSVTSNVSGTTNYVTKFTAANAVGNSDIQNNSTGIGLFVTPTRKFQMDLGGGTNVAAITNGTLALGSLNAYRGFSNDELLYLNGSMTFSNNKSIFSINSGGSVQQSLTFNNHQIGLFTTPSRRFHVDLGGGTNIMALTNGGLAINSINMYDGLANGEALFLNGNMTLANQKVIKFVSSAGFNISLLGYDASDYILTGSEGNIYVKGWNLGGKNGKWINIDATGSTTQISMAPVNGNVTIGAATGTDKFNVVGNASITGTLTVGNASTSGHAVNLGTGDARYLGIAATAANSSLLNGQNGAFYQNANNINSGTLGDARLSSNVALKNVNNSFSSAQSISTSSYIGLSILSSFSGYGAMYIGSALSANAGGQIGFRTNGTSGFMYLSPYTRTEGADFALFSNTGNTSLGSTTDTGEKFQVTGTAKFTGVVSGVAATAGGHFVTRDFGDARYLQGSGTNFYLPRYTGTNSQAVSMVYDNGNGVGVNSTNIKAAFNARGVAGNSMTTGSTLLATMMLENNGNNSILTFGGQSASPFGNWIQSTDKTDLSLNYALQLQPKGGSVVIGGYSDNGNRLQVVGDANISSKLAVGGAIDASYAINVTGGVKISTTLEVGTSVTAALLNLTGLAASTTNTEVLTINSSVVKSQNVKDLEIAAYQPVTLSSLTADVGGGVLKHILTLDCAGYYQKIFKVNMTNNSATAGTQITFTNMKAGGQYTVIYYNNSVRDLLYDSSAKLEDGSTNFSVISQPGAFTHHFRGISTSAVIKSF